MMPPAGSQNNPAISPQLKASIDARSQEGGNSAPMLSQQPGQSPMQPPNPPSPPGPGGQAPPANQSKSESELIVRALGQRLNSISKTEQQGGSQGIQAMPVGF